MGELLRQGSEKNSRQNKASTVKLSKMPFRKDNNRLSISNSSSITRSRWQRIIGHLSSIIWVNIHSNTRKLRDSNNNKVGEIRLQQASLHKVADGAHLPLHQAMQVLSRVDNRPRNTRLFKSSDSFCGIFPVFLVHCFVAWITRGSLTLFEPLLPAQNLSFVLLH